MKKNHSLLPRLIVFLAVALALLMPATNLLAQNNLPLCFTARNGSVTVMFNIKNATHTIQYSTDGTSWSTYTSNQEVALSADQSVYFRAESNQDSAVAFASSTAHSHFDFSSSNGGIVEGSGNIMSLYGPNCPNLPLQPYAFVDLFENCTPLTTAPSLPATTLESECYEEMFKGCTSLTTAPALPATTLANYCYEGMFFECSSLTEAPALPATTLAKFCYEGMFFECSSLTEAPALPATILEEYCYAFMFNGCTSLTTAPALPATTLADYCYHYMFSGCTSLTVAPSLPATTLEKNCYGYMFINCTSLTTAPTLPATTLAENCYYCMFKNCSSLTSIPSLPATTLEPGCYYEMFRGCSSLIVNETAPGKEWIIPATESADIALTYMFFGTGGTMNRTPQVNTVYYIASDSTTAVEDFDAIEYVVYSNNRQIVVRGAEGHSVTLYDINGRIVAQTANADDTQDFTVSAAGVYLVCVDKKRAKKVVVRD